MALLLPLSQDGLDLDTVGTARASRKGMPAGAPQLMLTMGDYRRVLMRPRGFRHKCVRLTAAEQRDAKECPPCIACTACPPGG